MKWKGLHFRRCQWVEHSHLGQHTYAQELTVHTFPIHTQMQACSWSHNIQKQRLQNDSSSHITYSATTQYSKVPSFLFNSQNRQRTGITRNTTPEKWWSLDRQIYSYLCWGLSSGISTKWQGGTEVHVFWQRHHFYQFLPEAILPSSLKYQSWLNP